MLTAVRREWDNVDAINQLIQTRMKKNLTLEQVAQDTKIPIRYLKAIENYQLNKLPKSDLTTMYLHRYAQYLDLSPEPILELFDKSSEVDSSPSINSQSTERSIQPSKAKKWGQSKWLWPAVLLSVIGLIGIGWLVVSLFFTEKEEASVQKSLTESNQSEEVSAINFPTAKNRAKLELIEPIEINEKHDRYQLSNVEKIELVVTAKTKPTSIEVSKNQDQTEKKTLKANEKVQFTDDQAISLRIQQPSQVQVSVNGITVEPSNPSKQVSYRFELQQ